MAKSNLMNPENPFDEFESSAEIANRERPAACMVCEAMLPEAVDGSLTAAEQRAFDTHLATCVTCSQELAEARRGAAWLTLLKQQAPEPPATLLAKILAAGVRAQASEAAVAVAPAVTPVTVTGWQPAFEPPARPAALPLWQRLHGWFATGWFAAESARLNLQALAQPRFAMTAAMAFFSIALTLNLTGVRLQNLHANSFTPAGLRRTVADAGASVTRTVVNNRSVYQMESRLNDLRNDASDDDHGPR